MAAKWRLDGCNTPYAGRVAEAVGWPDLTCKQTMEKDGEMCVKDLKTLLNSNYVICEKVKEFRYRNLLFVSNLNL